MILIDCNFLVAWSSSKTSKDDLIRLEHLAEVVQTQRKKILLPTPALAEFLVQTNESTAEWLNALERKNFIKVVGFDRKAAFECALLDRAALATGNKKGQIASPWQKIKVDRQIIAIGKSNGADTIITGDTDLRTAAISVGIKALQISDLPIPESAKQISLELPSTK